MKDVQVDLAQCQTVHLDRIMALAHLLSTKYIRYSCSGIHHFVDCECNEVLNAQSRPSGN